MTNQEGLYRLRPTANNRRGGWRVTIYRLGRTFDACFKESMYDDPACALAAAECFWREMQNLLPSKHTFHRFKEDGLPGSIKLVEGEYPHWRVMLSVKNKRRKKQYGIARYGAEEAFKLAQETRLRWLREAGYFKRRDLPKDAEVEQIRQRIRQRFNERELPLTTLPRRRITGQFIAASAA